MRLPAAIGETPWARICHCLWPVRIAKTRAINLDQCFSRITQMGPKLEWVELWDPMLNIVNFGVMGWSGYREFHAIGGLAAVFNFKQAAMFYAITSSLLFYTCWVSKLNYKDQVQKGAHRDRIQRKMQRIAWAQENLPAPLRGKGPSQSRSMTDLWSTVGASDSQQNWRWLQSSSF